MDKSNNILTLSYMDLLSTQNISDKCLDKNNFFQNKVSVMNLRNKKAKLTFFTNSTF